MSRRPVVAVFLFCLLFSLIAQAESIDPRERTPRVLKFSAALASDPSSRFEPGVVALTFSIYKERDDETPLWIGTQNVTIDEYGRFTVLLGENEKDGVPLELFTSGNARWLGIQRIPERERERVLLASVPYAIKAVDADTLGGKPLAAFVLSDESNATTTAGGPGKKKPVVNGVAGFIAKFIDTTNIDNSVLFESGGKIGLSTTSPQGPLHINSVVTYRGAGVGSVQTGNNPGIMLENPGTNTTVLLSESFGFNIFTSSSATAPLAGSDLRLVVRPNGNVGIAMNDPQAPLHIGASRLYRGLNVAAVQSAPNPGLLLENPNSNSSVALTENNGLFFFTSPSSTLPFVGSGLKMVLTIGGNLGIGTSTPTQRLDVAGNQRLTGNLDFSSGAGVITQNTVPFIHTFGVNNTFVGIAAGNLTNAAQGTTGVGASALQNLTSGFNNTGLGDLALSANTIGNSNTAVGAFALDSNTGGNNNTALGIGAGFNLTTGDENIDIRNSGVAGESGTIRIGSGNQTRAFLAGVRGVTTGAADGLAVLIDSNGQFGTVGNLVTNNNLVLPTTNSGGTAGVIIIGGNRFAHRFGSNNAFFGPNAGNFTMSGGANTGVGFTAVSGVTSGVDNTGVGAGALQVDTTGGDNTAVGASALISNTTGSDNTAMGSSALLNNTGGSFNTAMGNAALLLNGAGTNNTAIGNVTLQANSSGNFNTALGNRALTNNTTGNNNIGIGREALLNNTSGGSNIGIGFGGGQFLSTGNDNIDIGNSGVAAEAGVVRIGTNAVQTKFFVAGVRSVTTGTADAIAVMIDSTGQLGTVSSSARFKKDILDVGDASAALMQLRPVSFFYRNDAIGYRQYGLIAEEVAKVMPEMVQFSPTGEAETVRYHFLAPLLLDQVQKQQRQIDEQKKTIDTLSSTLENFAARLQELEALLARR